MSRGGSHPAYGVNPGVARNEARLAALVAWAQRYPVEREPCSYPAHRDGDWRLASGGPRTCGVCHPPALEVRP